MWKCKTVHSIFPDEAVRGVSHTSAGCVHTLLPTGKRGLTFTGETESDKKSNGKVPMLTDATTLSVS